MRSVRPPERHRQPPDHSHIFGNDRPKHRAYAQPILAEHDRNQHQVGADDHQSGKLDSDGSSLGLMQLDNRLPRLVLKEGCEEREQDQLARLTQPEPIDDGLRKKHRDQCDRDEKLNRQPAEVGGIVTSAPVTTGNKRIKSTRCTHVEQRPNSPKTSQKIREIAEIMGPQATRDE